jgi:hypothetical protein
MQDTTGRRYPGGRLLAMVFIAVIALPLIGNLAGLDGADAMRNWRASRRSAQSHGIRSRI